MDVVNLISDDDEDDCVFVSCTNKKDLAKKVENHSSAKGVKRTFRDVNANPVDRKGSNGRNDRTCDECGQLYSSRKNMMKHKKRHEREPVQCNYCDKVFRNRECLKDHWRKKSYHKRAKEKKILSCAHCFYQCFRKDKLLRHILGHVRKDETEEDYSCTSCGTEFKSHSDLRKHTWKHNAVKCKLCVNDPREAQCYLRIFKSNVQLIKHLVNYHKISEAAAIFFIRNDNPHMGNNNGSSKHQNVQGCDLKIKIKINNKIKKRKLPDSSSSDEESDDYEYIRHYDRPTLPSKLESFYKCGICADRFIDQDILSRHIKHVHFGIKQPTIDDENSDNISHILKAMKDERYQCIICAKTFFKKSGLKAHMMSH